MLIINDILAFILELIAIALYGMMAYQLSENRFIKILFVIISILLFAVIWGRYFAPNASNSLHGWVRWVFEFIILFLPWPLYFREEYTYIMMAGIVIIINLAIQALLGRSNVW
ncbi:YrdB family protein [Aerococcaceae bacterium DSM 111176]|nr:YrdB family protein [Aerococcaceae bacterium DSM 111176]